MTWAFIDDPWGPLVQIEAGPIGPVMDGIHKSLDSWLGEPKWKQGQGRVTLFYRFTTETEPIISMRVKVEINNRLDSVSRVA